MTKEPCNSSASVAANASAYDSETSAFRRAAFITLSFDAGSTVIPCTPNKPECAFGANQPGFAALHVIQLAQVDHTHVALMLSIQDSFQKPSHIHVPGFASQIGHQGECVKHDLHALAEPPEFLFFPR